MCEAASRDTPDARYEQNQHEPFWILYGGRPKIQDLGDVVTKQGRMVVFPNVLQHQVQPFELADKTRPGHRKIVALFLVDPAVRVPSTATVPPQQESWRERSALEARLPREVSQMVYDHLSVPFSLDKAKALREELIKERSANDDSVNNAMGKRGWNFCEH